MSASTTVREHMTADEFLAWGDALPEKRRCELQDGQVIDKMNERAIHGQTKVLFVRRIGNAIERANLPCDVFTGEMAVRIDAGDVYEPDVVVRCGDRLDADALVMSDPLVIVEIHSPSTSRIDATIKAERYLAIPSLHHYLIVNATDRRIIHHRRNDDGSFRTTIVGDAPLRLDPPGIEISDLFPPPA